MKKLAMVGIITVASASTFGSTGFIFLDNYDSNLNPLITYGVYVPANGVGGPLGTPGAGLDSDWTAGIYFVVGTPSISDPAGNGIPNAALALGIGSGSTAQLETFNGPYGSTLGEFTAFQRFDTGGVGGDTITAEIVAYPTVAGSYANALYRGHSAPFTMPTVGASTAIPSYVGDYMATFSVSYVPEPSTFALVGVGASPLVAWVRRRNLWAA
jgi:hypothetical protein